VVQPVPMSTMNVGVVGLGVQQPVVGRLPSRSARVRGGIGVLARLACRKFAPTHVTNAGDRAAE